MNKVLEILYEQLELNANDLKFAEGKERENAEVYNLQLQDAIKILEENERQENTKQSEKHNSKILYDIMYQNELLTDFMDMIEEGGMIKFNKAKLLHDFKKI